MYGPATPAPNTLRIAVPNRTSTIATTALRTVFAMADRASTFAAVTSSFGNGIANS